MIDFPISNLCDDSLCLTWLMRHLYPKLYHIFLGRSD